ncbi:hypothetical protein GQ53DRAFT_344355 [Thozetella sp. PMI_491]|nr:hypothetical protein GQ53DRAFT_344355 [Thozetella sp. PMI_491]
MSAPLQLPSDAAAAAVGAPVALQETPALQNRAGTSTSPYIQAHATSAITWQLLDDEALAHAHRENKLIFLHVGFAACHYCHLTNQDSFSNPAVASILNESFIPVLVDREERPDIDGIYQNYIQAVNGTGGWPLNLFLTPELEPVFGGTYFPGPGVDQNNIAAGSSINGVEDISEEVWDFLSILNKLKASWLEQETRCRKEAREILPKLRDIAADGQFGSSGTVLPATEASGPGKEPSTEAQDALIVDLDLDQLEEAVTTIASTFDEEHGGWGAGQKFPTPAKLSFLLRLSKFPQAVRDVVGEDESKRGVTMALKTLRSIRNGGLRDHVGAGFGRYSVTPNWRMPHFEKMVVDNGLLLGVYLDAWLGQVKAGAAPSKEDEFADIVLGLADYLTAAPILQPAGGFATSEAADSFYKKGDRQMQQGAYYLWTRREFDSVIGANDAQATTVAAAYWNVLQHGNVSREQDPLDEFINLNVLSVPKDMAEISRQFGIPVDNVKQIVGSAREKLLAHREKERVRPATDEKIVVSINGIVVAALARTASAVRAIDAERADRYLTAARKAAQFIKENLWQDSVLYRVFYKQRGTTRGFADDYAFLIQALLDLYEATFEEEWLRWADELQQVQIKLFYDTTGTSATPTRSASGGFYSTEEGAPHTILRLKDGMDTVMPSTNATSASNLFRLGAVLGDGTYTKLAKETVSAFEVEVLQHHFLFVGLLTGVVTARLGGQYYVVHDEPDVPSPATQTFLANYHTTPRAEARVVVRVDGCTWLLERNPALKDVAKGVSIWRDGAFRPVA